MSDSCPNLTLKPIEPAEKDIQSAILQYLAVCRSVAWAYRFNTGAHSGVNPKTKKRRFVRYAFVGCSDILGQMTDGRFLAIEVKRPGHKTKKDRLKAQQDFIDLVNNNGGIGIMADDLTKVVQRLKGESDGTVAEKSNPRKSGS